MFDVVLLQSGLPVNRKGPKDKEKALEIVKDSVGAIFARVLEDAGVYKQTEQGQAAFMRGSMN